MTKLKELAIQDIKSFNSIEMAKVYEFICLLKNKKQTLPASSDAYLKVREALQLYSGSLSDDILQSREETL